MWLAIACLVELIWHPLCERGRHSSQKVDKPIASDVTVTKNGLEPFHDEKHTGKFLRPASGKGI